MDIDETFGGECWIVGLDGAGWILDKVMGGKGWVVGLDWMG